MSVTEKSPGAFRTISEAADELDVPAHVLRFWESKFPQISPLKRAGGRRFYRPEDLALLRGIKRLLYEDGFTIKGARKFIADQGVAALLDPAEGGMTREPAA
ncbi:MAG: DNA-binding transcriptional MerR regulator, partial [Maricaulis sp.]